MEFRDSDSSAGSNNSRLKTPSVMPHGIEPNASNSSRDINAGRATTWSPNRPVDDGR